MRKKKLKKDRIAVREKGERWGSATYLYLLPFHLAPRTPAEAAEDYADQQMDNFNMKMLSNCSIFPFRPVMASTARSKDFGKGVCPLIEVVQYQNARFTGDNIPDMQLLG